MSGATRGQGPDPEAIDFDQLVAPTPLGAGRFSIDVPDGWQQGRGAFGGLVLAIMARAAEATAADPSRVLRSLTAQIVGPVQPGTTEIAAEVVRAGSAVTSMTVRMVQAGQVMAHAAVILGRSRPTYAAATTLTAPEMPSWRDPANSHLHLSGRLPPTFATHLEYWPTTPLPYSGADAAAALETAGWVRLRRPGRARDAAFVLALIDAYWPGLLTDAREPRAAATLTFSLETMSDLDGLDPEAPLFYRGRMLGGRDGYAVEARELWGEDCRLVALNQQIFAVMK
jgi:acyl-CoA thioesterase